jgi:hypothetical protein
LIRATDTILYRYSMYTTPPIQTSRLPRYPRHKASKASYEPHMARLIIP